MFELAIEENKVDDLLGEIGELQDIIEKNDEFGKLMTHPKINKEEKLQVVTEVFKGRVSDELLGFLTIVISKDRYQDIDDILDYFLTEVKKYKGIGVATVTTAVPLKEEQCKKIEKKLLDTTNFKSMEMHYKQDETLIGGMVIRIGDRVVDSSISTKLNELQKELLRVQI